LYSWTGFKKTGAGPEAEVGSEDFEEVEGEAKRMEVVDSV